MAFLSDVQTHLNTFAAQNQVGEDEIHVIKAEFQLAPSERKPIGFQSETAE